MKCKYCGADLPEASPFCPHCAKNLIEKKDINAPMVWRKKTIISVISVAVIAVLVAVCVFFTMPRTYSGEGSVKYSASSGEYEFITAFHPTNIKERHSVDSQTIRMPKGEESAIPALLGVFKNGEPLDNDAFSKLIKSCTLEVVSAADEKVKSSEAAYREDFLPALRQADIEYTGCDNTIKIKWIIKLTDGNTVNVGQTLEIKVLVHKEYTPDDVDLTTTEKLREFIEEIERELPVDTVVDIHLPAVTYTERLDLTSRSYSLYGCVDDTGRTVFSGTLCANSESPYNIQVHDIDFIADGGTGISATSSVIMTGCTFKGLDIGATILDGGMIVFDSCTFEDNKIGLKYNTGAYHSFSDRMPNCTFKNNDIAVQFAKLKGQIAIDFTESEFIDNKIDIDNPIGYPVIQS